MMFRFLLYVPKIKQKQLMKIIQYFHKSVLVNDLGKENRMQIGWKITPI